RGMSLIEIPLLAPLSDYPLPIPSDDTPPIPSDDAPPLSGAHLLPVPIDDDANSDGPRERAIDEGIGSLGDAELLAVLLGTGLAGRPVSLVAAGLLDRSAGLAGLSKLSPAAIAEHPAT